MRILCVHGVAGHPAGGAWEAGWKDALTEALGTGHDIAFCHLDAVFAATRLGPVQTARALALLMGQWLRPREQQEAAGTARAWLGEAYERTAGMVLEWVGQPAVRAAARALLAEGLRTHRPQMLIGHSLGSLVALDTLLNEDTRDAQRKLHLVVLGSQLGHDAVRPCFGGRLAVPPGVRRMTQLYNPHDRVFTEPLPLRDARFQRLDLPFDSDAPLQHEATDYLRRASALRTQAGRRAAPPAPAVDRARAPRRRALLVGINEYLDPNTAPLRGCVNDAWLLSALLQESGFAADEIRMVLNHRASADALVERLDWLVDGARPGDTCVFYYSGHGAQVPVYGGDGQHVEAVHESLVPHDFDWTRGRAFNDQQFARLYAQLPYELNFLALFDCCHSGGLTRAGSQRVRGLNPPDDVRHRMLRWDAEREMWLPRAFASPAAEFAARHARRGGGELLSPTHRMGLAQVLRADGSRAAQRKLAAQYQHLGPYMPTLLYACEDAEFAHEYEHGPIHHGAFTYSLVKRLRAARRRQQTLSFEQLVRGVRQELQQLGYTQTPQLVAPSAVRGRAVPLTV
jgi:hypothetical protein